MLIEGTSRFKPKQVDGALATFEAAMTAAETAHTFQSRAIVGVAAAIFLVLLFAAPELVIFSILFLLVAVYFAVSTNQRLERARAKLDFARELLELLRDELLPHAKATLRFDLRHYQLASKRFWTGRSVHGNRKEKYSDKWFTLKAALADGSHLLIRRQAGVKTKSGGIVKEKRRLFVTVTPNPVRYDLSAVKKRGNRLRNILEGSAERFFHNRPEDFQTQVTSSGNQLKVKVMQLDAPILPREVFDIVHDCCSFLSQLERARPDA